MENTAPQQIGDILKLKKNKKPPTYEWQDLALTIIKELKVPNFKRSSVFKICKENRKDFVIRCLNDTRELCKTGQCWKYFFKVINSKDGPKL